MKNFLKNKIIFVIFVLQMTLFYKIIQNYLPGGQIFKIPIIDDHIPFLAVFVIPYFLFAVVLFLPFLMTFKDNKKFLAVSVTFLAAAIVCNIIYVLFQTTVTRPEILPSSIFQKLIIFIYSIDDPVNLFPSGHVTFSVLSNLCIYKINKKIALWLIPITILIVSSTLFIKQHHTPDILAGLALAILCYKLVFKKFNLQ